jgi:endoglucanase
MRGTTGPGQRTTSRGRPALRRAGVAGIAVAAAAPGAIGQLTIQACTGTGGQVVKKQGSYYVFTATGNVMDLRGGSTVNGNQVIAYPQNGGKNQQWSLP